MNEIQKAKETLKNAGYFVDNLWCEEDVKGKYKCDSNTAQHILEQALTNEATMEQIQFSIREFASIEGLEKLEETQ